MIRIKMKYGDHFTIQGGPTELQTIINEVEIARFANKMVTLRNVDSPIAAFPASEVGTIAIISEEQVKQEQSANTNVLPSTLS